MKLYDTVKHDTLQAAGSRESLSDQVACGARTAQVLSDREQTV